MKLTAEQETQFLNEHEKKICDFVNRYQRKAGKRYPDNTEDLLQEAR